MPDRQIGRYSRLTIEPRDCSVSVLEKKQLDPIRLRKRADLLKKGKRSDVVSAEAQ